MEFVSKGIYIYSLSSSMWNYKNALNKIYITYIVKMHSITYPKGYIHIIIFKASPGFHFISKLVKYEPIFVYYIKGQYIFNEPSLSMVVGNKY